MPVLPAPAAPEGSQCHCHCCRLPCFWRLPHLQGLRVGSGGGKRVTVELGLLFRQLQHLSLPGFRSMQYFLTG